MDIVEVLKKRAVVGHRGYPRVALENTLESIKAALEHGADAVEVDVQVTADGVVVLSHDDTLDRTFGVSIDVRRSRWPDLSPIRRGPHRLATLEEALSLVDGRAGVLVEVKHPEDAPLVADVVKNAGASRWVALISFHEEAVRGLSLYKGLIYAQPPGKIVEAKRLGCHLVLPRYQLATAKAVSFAHRLGLYVVAWTVNDLATAVELWRRGVDGVATDDVGLIKKSLS
ncbi:MAG: glycerophosphodiester phosphodiesterase [Pyrobaculum sp.]